MCGLGVNWKFWFISRRSPFSIQRKIPSFSATSRELCSCYQRWCRDNAVKPQSDKTLISYLKEHSGEYNVVYTNKIPIGGGRTARGFLNVGVEDPGWDAYT